MGDGDQKIVVSDDIFFTGDGWSDPVINGTFGSLRGNVLCGMTAEGFVFHCNIFL